MFTLTASIGAESVRLRPLRLFLFIYGVMSS